MSIIKQLRALAQTPASAPKASTWGHTGVVGYSSDLERIMALPRRPIPNDAEQSRMAAQMTARLRRNNPRCQCAELRPEVVARGQNPCITELRPIQGWYLVEAEKTCGAVGFIAVGGGKTGIDILTAMVVPGIKLAVLLIRPSAVPQFLHDFKCWSQHFQVPNLVGGEGPFVPGLPRLEVFPYSQMQLPKNANWLKTRNPDLFIGDEIHNLKDRKATRTGRFMVYLAENEERVRCCFHSASFTTRGMSDFGHLMAAALKGGSPVPLDPETIDEWGEALDPHVGGLFGSALGQLKHFCLPGEEARKGVHRRIVETPGVVATYDSAIPSKLVIHEAEVGAIPAAVLEALRTVRNEYKRPDGEELQEELEAYAVAAQVSCGFFYRWKYPRGEPEGLIAEWFAKRKAWNKEVRLALLDRRDGLDSPKLLREAAERYVNGYRGPLPVWPSWSFGAWRAIEDKVQPAEDFVWIDDFLARAVARMATEGEPGIVWYGYREFGRRVAELSGLRRFGEGKKASAEILKERGEKSVVASIRAHGIEKNLQYAFSRMWFPNPISDGGTYEQAIGRVHRPGQSRATVEAFVFRHTNEMRSALEHAIERAHYIQGMQGNPQKLLYGEWHLLGASKK